VTVDSVFLGLEDLDNIGKRGLGALLSGRVGGKHNSNNNTENSLLELDVTDSAVDEVNRGLTGLDHVAITELHGLGTLGSELTADDDLATLSLGLHNGADDTVASATNGETTEELVSEGLSLSLGRKTTVDDTLGVQLDLAISDVETLLDGGGELANAASLLAEDILGAGGTDDNLNAGGGHADLNTGVTILGELTREEGVQLSIEKSILDKLYSCNNKQPFALLVSVQQKSRIVVQAKKKPEQIASSCFQVPSQCDSNPIINAFDDNPYSGISCFPTLEIRINYRTFLFLEILLTT
jgi:hypothetical protein